MEYFWSGLMLIVFLLLVIPVAVDMFRMIWRVIRAKIQNNKEDKK